jgi:hypothetical protein
MPQIRKSSFSAPVRILYQGMVMYRLAGTGFAVSDMRSGRRAVIVGIVSADRRRGYVDLPCCSSARSVAAHTAALLQQIIITLCSRARRCDVTTRRPPAYAVW